MARKCATHRQRNSVDPSGGQFFSARRLLCLTVFAAILLYFGYGYFTNDSEELVAPTIMAEETTVPTPRFEFYRLLADADMLVPLENKTDDVPAHATPILPDKQYMIQVASLQNITDASHLKTQLVAMGFEAEIYSYTDGETDWYRLRLGPYDSEHMALNMQQQLLRNDFSAVILQVEDQNAA